MRTRRTISLAVTIAVVITGCSSKRTPESTASAAKTTVVSSTTTPAMATAPAITTAKTLPAAYTGSLNGFYDAPNPLPEGQPGQLIRYEPVAHTATTQTWRILYHSVDAAGRDQAVPGTVTFPTTNAPSGGWPVLSIAPGTVGLDSHCGLSRTGGAVDSFGLQGVAVRTDYIGMANGQTQRYLSGVSEAHSVIDAVRAARNIPAAHAGERWVAFGHSQGGHSALFTNQLARSWAPELDLLGTVVGAPAAELTRTFGPDDQVVPAMVELLGVFGIGADHPKLDPAHYLTPEVTKNADVFHTGCMNEIINAFAGLAATGKLFRVDPITTEPAASIVRANDPGKVKAPSPILLFEGTKDTYVVPARAEAVRAQLCKIGQRTQYLVIPGADHGTEIPTASKQIGAWIADRFANKTAPDNCPSN